MTPTSLLSPDGRTMTPTEEDLMGYARYEIYRNGEKIEAGYDVEAMCDKPDCTTRIWRGLDALCGQTPGGDEHGCGDYFCDEHLYLAPEREHGWRCILCNDKDSDPLETSPDAMVVAFT
ncbi:hypothetical protein ACF1DY_26125 [Streptomyces albus]